MKLIAGLFAAILAEERPAGFDDKAEKMCVDYMTGKGRVEVFG